MKMNEEKMTDLLIKLSSQISEMAKDISYLKTEMNSNYIRSDENDNAIRELIEQKQEAIRIDLQSQIDVLKKNSELQKQKYDLLVEQIDELKNRDKNRVYAKWEKVADKIFWIIIAIIFGAVFKYFNITPPKPI